MTAVDTAAPATAACRFCGAAAAPAFRVGDRNRRISQATFAYVGCPACGCVSLPDPPADLGRYYGAEDYFGEVPADELAARAPEDHWRLAFLPPDVAPPGAAVEIGPGNGRFAYLLKEAGYKVTAVEQSPRAAAYVRDVVGVEVIESADPIAALGSLAPAKLIALWHVLEHVPDPSGLLEAIAAGLEPGGVALLAIPNPDSLGFKLLGRRWPHVDAPRHLTLIPPATLLAALARGGLAVETARTDDVGARHGNWWAWAQTVRAARVPPGVAEPAARVLARVLRSPEGPRGSSFTVVARKL